MNDRMEEMETAGTSDVKVVTNEGVEKEKRPTKKEVDLAVTARVLAKIVSKWTNTIKRAAEHKGAEIPDSLKKELFMQDLMVMIAKTEADDVLGKEED